MPPDFNSSQLSSAPDPVTALIASFLESRTNKSWGVDEDLFGSGAITSLFALELVVHIEREFNVEVVGPELSPENLRTIRSIASMVGRLTRDGDAARDA